MTRAVLFDMDGVVVDSERHWQPIENERILPRAVEDGDPTAAEVTGMNVSDIYDYLDREYGVAVDREAFVASYDEAARELYTERVELMAGFEDLLDRLRGRGLAVALVSSSPPEWIDYVLERFDLSFAAVVSGDEVDGPSKPAPDVYLAAADRLGVDPGDCVAVEDSTHGVEAAVAAGADAVGYRSSAGQDLSNATAVVDGPRELADYLVGL